MKNKTVIITGASSGIGRACVEVFSKHKYNILCLGRDKSKLKKTVKEAKLNGAASATYYSIDFLETNSIEDFFNTLNTKNTTIDCLINAAGTSKISEFDKINELQWEQTYKINVTSPFMMIKYCVPFLEKSKNGSIINVSSIAGRFRSISLGCDYSSSKAALIGMTKHLSAELGAKGIRINVSCPSQTHTPMLDGALSKDEQVSLAQNNPLKRLSDPREQAEVIYFLSSLKASYINGAVIDVNGGAY